MSHVKLLAMAAEQSLAEGEVGVATTSCIFPGIAQCFAVAGVRGSAMVCTHVTPSTTQEQMDDTFANLRDIGGESVMYWYLLGPFADHFAGRSTLWKSVADIKSTFKTHFKSKSATHLILDAQAERNTKTLDLSVGPEAWFKTNSIDIRARLNGATVQFDYRLRANKNSFSPDWNEFDLTKFTRF